MQTAVAGDGQQERRIELVVQSLQTRFAGAVSPEVIEREVDAAFAAYSHARVTEFVPILVEARVRSTLRTTTSR